MDLNIQISALEKLIDYAASGIGSAAGHLFATRIARQKAETTRIGAEGAVDASRILAEGQAATMQIIAKAQADARATLAPNDAMVQGEVAIGDLVSQRIQFQEEKRQANIGSVVGRAALGLGDREVQDHEVDHDWTARFFNDAQDVSSDEMQQLWAKVLEGEVERPGRTSIKTLGILKNLNKDTATLFRRLCSACVSIRPDGISFLDARVPSLGGNAAQNALQEYGLGFGNLNILNEHGLIISDYNSWFDIGPSMGLTVRHHPLVRIPIHFRNRYWILEPTIQRKDGQEFRISGVALTKSGQELSRIVDLESNDQYARDLARYFQKNNLKMTEVASWQGQVISRRRPMTTVTDTDV